MSIRVSVIEGCQNMGTVFIFRRERRVEIPHLAG